ncbi:MAG: hypothetical protein QOH21_1960 [Acidobacteriota bacterium]|jgi:hypothetical protein|nr:hypothetical protein [Acidobacteriota bacterium]
MRSGIITRVEDFGLGFIRTADNGALYVFTFDKIAGYRGESARALDLRAGRHVTFAVEDGRVRDVHIHSHAA